MKTLKHRGRSRLMLRLPAWRAELGRASGPDFSEICEDYELAWNAIPSFARRHETDRIEELLDLAAYLETEAVALLITPH